VVRISVLNMVTSKEHIARKVFIDCPVCCSGNRFQLENLSMGLACEDCGFVLVESTELQAGGFDRCVFCGGGHFYLESPLLVSLLGRDSVCYVCKAKYKGVQLHNPEQKFNANTRAKARQSDASERWQERVKRYSQGAG
jgi:hypothetical protein